MTNSQAELDELKGRSQDLDRFRSSLQKLTDEFSSLRHAAEGVLGRLREHDQFVDSRKDEVKQLLTAATDTIKTFEGRKEDLIEEIHGVLTQVQGSFNRLSSEIGTKAVETINTTSLQIFQLRKSLLDFTEKKSEELRAALSGFEDDLLKLKTEHRQALRNLPAVNEQVVLVEDRLKEMIHSGQASTDSLREEVHVRYRETRDGLDRLDQRVGHTQDLLEQTRQEIEAALRSTRDEISRLLGDSQRKWDQLSVGYSDMRGALDIIDSSRKQYESSLQSLRQEIDEGLRSNADEVSILSGSFGERIEAIQAEYRHQMGAMLERVESATQDTEQNIGVIRQEIEKTLKESSERISGFLISSEEKINDLKLNHYQTRAALDRLERSQQESDRAASATRVEVSEAVRESRDLLSDFAAMTNQKIEEMKSTHRRELDGVLTRLDTLRREGESAITRAKQETERTLKDKLDHMTGFLQTSEEKFDALRSDQLAIKVSLDQVQHSREEADKAVAALSGDLGKVLSKTREEVTSLLQESDERLKSLRADYEKLQVSLESSEKAPGGTAAALDSIKREVSDLLRTHLESTDQRYDALTSEHRREIGALRQEIEEARGQFEGTVDSIRNEFTQTMLLARQETPGLAREFERRLEQLSTLQDNRIRSLSGMVETLKEENARALASLNDQLAETVRQNIEALHSLVKSAGERDSELASRYVEMKGYLEALEASEGETRNAVGRIAEEFDGFKRETASQRAEALREAQARLDHLRTERHHLIDDAVNASRADLAGIIDDIRKDLSETRAELAMRTAETGSVIGSLREELERLGSATAAEIPAGRSVVEARIEELKTGFRQSLDTILKRVDASAEENEKSLGAVKHQLESSLGETAQRLSLIEDSSRDQLAKTSFDRLREITALRELIDRSRQDTLHVVTELKEKVEATLDRYGEDLSRLQAATEERFTAAQAAHQDLKEELRRIEAAREESHSDLSMLKAHIENLSSEASKTLANVVSRLEARINEATAGSGAEVSALRRDLTSLNSEYAEAVKTLECQSADLSSLRDEMRQSLEDRQPHSEELLNQLRSDYLKEITMVLDRIEIFRGEDQKALESLRQETEQKIADESQQIRELLRGTTAQVTELRSGTAVINTVLDHVERLAEDNQKTRQEVTQILEESRSELVGAIGATQETVDLLKSRYLEIQTLLEGVENNRPDSAGAIASFKEEIENHLRDYLSDLGNQGAAPPAEIEELRAGYRTIQERVSEAVNENKRIQGELQDEIQYRTRETREQVTGLIDRKTHQFHESFTTLVEHKDTMLKSAFFSAVSKQRTFALLLFLMSIMISFALFYFGKR